MAANHALGDVWAMGGRPSTVLAVAVVPLMAEPLVEEELSLLMAGALQVRAFANGIPCTFSRNRSDHLPPWQET